MGSYARPQFSCPSAEELVAEAHSLANFLIEREGPKQIDCCIHCVCSRFGLDPGVMHSLRYRWRELHDVKASTLERLRAAYEHVYERERRVELLEREIEQLTEREMETV